MNKYLEKVALTRLVAELAKGVVKTPLENLVEKGALRSGNRYIEGMKRGNKALAKKIGVNVTKVKKFGLPDFITSTSGGAVTIPSPRGSDIMFSPKIMSGGKHSRELAIRHELFEARELKNQISTSPPKNLYSDVLNHPYLKLLPPGEKFSKMKTTLEKAVKRSSVPVSPASMAKFESLKGIHIGTHANPSILTHESEVIRKNPYLKNASVPTYRKVGGEAALLRKITNKRYGVDKLTGKDHIKMKTLSPNSTSEDSFASKVNVFKLPDVSNLHIAKYIKEINPNR